MQLSQLSMQNENIGELNSQKYLSFHRFLTNFGIDSYKINFLTADCSLRRYYRILSDLGSHILMDSSQDSSIDAFIYITSALNENGLRCPKIFYTDLESGYLLIEDFGNNLLTTFLKKYPSEESNLYKLCINTLIKLAEIPTINLQVYNYSTELLNAEIEIFCEWYLKQHIKSKYYNSAHNELMEIFNNLYLNLDSLPKVLTLRDFMADNIMILESTSPQNKIGLIDFQDAVIGSCPYDLVSLLEDARRDINTKIVKSGKKMYCAALKLKEAEFDIGYTILGLQRNLKIVGIFNRMHLRDKQSKYLSYLPRVWSYINKGLQKKIAFPLRNWFIKYDIYN